jgi:hypothetical protein
MALLSHVVPIRQSGDVAKPGDKLVRFFFLQKMEFEKLVEEEPEANDLKTYSSGAGFDYNLNTEIPEGIPFQQKLHLFLKMKKTQLCNICSLYSIY